MHGEVETIACFRGSASNGYTLVYGFGSVWTSAGHRGTGDGKGARDGSGCRHFSKSVGQKCRRTGQGCIDKPGRNSFPGARLGQQAARSVTQAAQTKEGLKRGSKRFGEAVWGPFVKLSGVLWLEVTGVFFGIFALFAIGGAWKLRDGLHKTVLNHDGHVRFLGAVAMAVLFGYFCVSSFVSANRRSRRR